MYACACFCRTDPMAILGRLYAFAQNLRGLVVHFDFWLS